MLRPPHGRALALLHDRLPHAVRNPQKVLPRLHPPSPLTTPLQDVPFPERESCRASKQPLPVIQRALLTPLFRTAGSENSVRGT